VKSSPSKVCWPNSNKLREPNEAELKTFQLYFIAGDAKNIEDVQQTFNKGSLLEVVKNFKGQWLNRDPYGVYKALNTPTYLKDHNYLARNWFIPPLEPIRGWAPDEVELFHRRYLLFCSIEDTYQEKFNMRWLYDFPNPNELYIGNKFGYLNDPVFTQLPLPTNALPEKLTTLKIIPGLDTRPAVMQQFLDSLRTISCPILFDIIGHKGSIYFHLVCAPRDQDLIERQLQLHFPEFAILPLSTTPATPPIHTFAAAPSLSYTSLKTSNDFAIDPYQQLFTVLAATAPEDYTSIQFSFAPLNNIAVQMIANFAGNYKVSDTFMQRFPGLQRKQPAWFVGLRLFASQPATLEAIKPNFLKQYETPEQRWEFSKTVSLPTKNQKISPWGIVSTPELATLVHFPDKTAECDLLETVSMKAKLPPDLYTQRGVAIGRSRARGKTQRVTIPDSVRDRHTYVVGKSGTGKSTLLFNTIWQDIVRGHGGVTVIDPHGDLVEEVLRVIPKRRIEDTIYFNAADKDHPIGLNIFNAQSEDEIGLLADDLLITFKRLSESWGERMENILRHTIHTLLRTENATFLDIKTLLQNPDYRQQVAAQTNNRMLRDFWQLEYPSYPKDAAQPILNRMSKFSLSPTLTGILGQPDSSLNFFDVIQNKKILLVNISKGQISEDTAQLLGSLIMSQLQLAIMRRAAMPKETRDPYFLYVDEFQNFTTSAFEKILSEARKYKLCLTLAHQYISQLDERTKNAILANVGTMVMFQSYPADAQALRPELGQYEPTDVTNLNTAEHQALCKPSTQSKDTFMFQTLAPLLKRDGYAREIIEYTRENYAGSPVSYAVTTAVSIPPSAPPAPTQMSRPKLKRPARALPKDFASAADKVLHYIKETEWLATPHLIQLCYGHLETEGSKKSVASRDLKQLVEAKRVRATMFGPNKIYFFGRTPNTTKHNYSVRNLYTKIVASEFEIAEMNFFPSFVGLTPDLAVSFLAEDGSQIKTFWEYDAGTEGLAELLKKVSRYDVLAKDALVVFVFNTRERLLQFQKAAGTPRVVLAVLDEFTTLEDSVFVFGGEAASEASALFPSV
jgi:Type IV secretion-system coupling protein DNA-binding domain